MGANAIKAILAALLLCACTTAGNVAGTGVTLSRTLGPDPVAATFDAASSAFMFAANGAALTGLAPDTTYDTDMMSAYKNSANTEFAFAYANADGLVATIASAPGQASNAAGVVFESTSQTTLRGSGNAFFTGDYAGFLRAGNSSSGQPLRLINGRVVLAADFLGEKIQGTIYDRTLHDPDTNDIDNANPLRSTMLGVANILPNGEFSGSASDGRINTAQWTDASGTYSGLIIGADGDAVVGGIEIAHTQAGGTTFTEIGGFYGDE